MILSISAPLILLVLLSVGYSSNSNSSEDTGNAPIILSAIDGTGTTLFRSQNGSGSLVANQTSFSDTITIYFTDPGGNEIFNCELTINRSIDLENDGLCKSPKTYNKLDPGYYELEIYRTFGIESKAQLPMKGFSNISRLNWIIEPLQ